MARAIASKAVAGGAAALAALIAAWPGAARAGAASTVADAGSLRARVTGEPWRLTLVDGRGRVVLAEDRSTGQGASGRIGFRSGGAWYRATRMIGHRRQGRTYVARLETTDPGGRTLEVRIAPSAEGAIALEERVHGAGAPIEALGLGFDSRPR